MDLFPMIPITGVAQSGEWDRGWGHKPMLMDRKSTQYENASVEQWQIGTLSIMNKAAVMVAMWKISKKGWASSVLML